MQFKVMATRVLSDHPRVPIDDVLRRKGVQRKDSPRAK